MESRIMQVFYGNDCLPYKDKERKVHYPIIGNTFAGANNTTTIRFYVDRIGGTDNVKWVAVSKLPNEQIGSEVLGDDKVFYDEELNESYVELSLSKYYTSLKGDVAISLNGYEGGVNVIENDGIYTILGSPTIQATGVVMITINYAPQIIPKNTFSFSNLQLILAELQKKLDKINGFYIIDDISTADLSSFLENQFFFDITTTKFYLWNGETYSEAPITANIVVDSALSSTSENPVQNKVIYSALQDKANTSALGDQVSFTYADGLLTITSI